MTNIVTRKGLAFGALVALTSTAIAGAPANAAGEINFAPSAGTSYNTIAGEIFTLEASFAPGFAPAAASQLKYVVTTDGSDIDAAVGTSASAVATDLGTSAADKETLTSNSVVIASGRAQQTDRAFIGLQLLAATDTESVTVTAFSDSNNDGALTPGEWNTVRTVGFKKVADVTATTTVTAPVKGDSSLKATINFGDLNTQQIAIGHFASKFAVGTATASQTGTVEAYNTDGTIAVTATTAVSAADVVYTVTPLYELDGTVADASTIGSAGTATSVAAGFAFFASVKGSAASGQITTGTSGASAYTDATTPANSVTAATGAITVKRNDTFAVTAVVKNNASTPAVVAGQVVYATITSTNALSTSTTTPVNLTVNGTNYTANTALPGQGSVAKLALTSDANGAVVVNFASVGLADGDQITVAFTSQNISVSTVVTQAELDFTIAESNTVDHYATTPGATQALTYSVKDQFGVAISGAYRVKAAVTGGTANTFYGNVVNGVATINVTDTQLATATSWTNNTVAASLEVQDASSLNWAADATAGRTVTGDSTVIHYGTTAVGFSTAPAIDATTGINNNAWTAAGDQKQKVTQLDLAGLNSTTTVVPVAAGDVYAKLTFVGAVQYQTVTVSGSGVYLSNNAAAAKADSITFQAGASDVVYVAANTVGTKTITFTSGAVTKTVDVKFASAGGATARGTATNFAVAVAAAAQSGRAIDATVTVTDKWGNPVEGFIGVATVSGVALLNGKASDAITTDANGKATVKLSAGVNDLGDAVVTFSDNDTNTSTDVTAVAKTVTFGMTDGFIDVLNGKRASVTWSFAKGKRAAFYLDGVRKYNLVQPGDAEMNLQFNLKKGTHTIKLVIGGVTVDSITVKISK